MKISKEKMEKISEQILLFLYSVNPKSMFTLHIAKELARLKGIEFVSGRLVKIKNVPPQTSLVVKERKKNVSGAFGILRGEDIKGKVVLLVDDVYTTGSTIRECSSVLRDAGVTEVKALTVAQA